MSFLTIIALAFGMSMDTFAAATGLRRGSLPDDAIGKRAEILGGLVLIGIGSFILAEHLDWL